MQYVKYLRAFSSILVLVSVVSIIVVGIMAVVDPEQLKSFFEQSIEMVHSLGLVGSLLIMTIAALTAFPAELPAIACGAMYGLVPGFFVAWATAMIGASIAFAVARYVDQSILKSVFGEKLFATIRKRANENSGLMTLFLIRLIPMFPFFVVNFASGMSGMRYRSYLLATGAGMIPGAFVSSAIGAGLMFANMYLLLFGLSVVVLVIFSLRIYRNSKVLPHNTDG